MEMKLQKSTHKRIMKNFQNLNIYIINPKIRKQNMSRVPPNPLNAPS